MCYVRNYAFFSGIFKIFRFLNYFTWQDTDVLLNYNHFNNKIQSLNDIRCLVTKILLNIFEQH